MRPSEKSETNTWFQAPRKAAGYLVLAGLVMCLQPLGNMLFQSADAQGEKPIWPKDTADPLSRFNEPLSYGTSTRTQLVEVLGKQPDRVIRTAQSSPVLENLYYNNLPKPGYETVFIFQGNILVGSYEHVKTQGKRKP